MWKKILWDVRVGEIFHTMFRTVKIIELKSKWLDPYILKYKESYHLVTIINTPCPTKALN